MKILITGGTGYVGRQIIKKLSNSNHIIVSPSRQECDFTNKSQVNEYFKRYVYFDCVIHCATNGRNYVDYKETCLQDNISMYYNITQNKNYYERLLIFGSGAQFRESDNIDPYDLSKKVISDISINDNYTSQIVIWNVFNQNQDDDRFIKANILRYINHQDLFINKNMLFDFFHMDDLMIMINEWIFSVYSKDQTRFCAYSKKRQLLDVANIINNLSDYKVKISEYEYMDTISYTSNNRCDFDNLQVKIKQVYECLI